MSTVEKLKPGDNIRVEGHKSVLNGLNAYVLGDGGEEIWFITSHDNKSTIVPNGTRHVLPREFIRKGMA
jgi:hypothetical protein